MRSNILAQLRRSQLTTLERDKVILKYEFRNQKPFFSFKMLMSWTILKVYTSDAETLEEMRQWIFQRMLKDLDRRK